MNETELTNTQTPSAAVQDLSVVETVFNLAADDPELSERQTFLVLASMQGDDALAAELSGVAATRSTSGTATAKVEEPPVGAFLKSISVSGFRGIGETSRLDLHPGPGLTVVAGRNGSGKSSFAEALEYALTGDSYRWFGKKASFWKDSWRNLHQSHPAALQIELAEEGAGRTEIGVEWSADGNLEDRKVWTQRQSAKRKAGIDSLGWRNALELYRPILSYDELGRRLDGSPTDLYRSLENILGLDQIADGIDRLSDEVKRLKGPSTEVTAAKRALRLLLESAQDERAQSAFAEIKKNKPNLELLSRLATGMSAPDQLGERLQALSEVAIPDREEVERAAQDLLAAVQELALMGAGPTRADARSNLLEQALALYSEHGDQSCPVCSVGALDGSWRERVAAQLEAEKVELAAVRSAHQKLTECREAAFAQIAVPELPILRGDLALAGLPEAEATLKAWREAPSSDVELARHLTSGIASLITRFSLLRDEASAQLSGRDESWRELAQRIAAWVELKRAADAVSADLAEVTAAFAWLKKNAETLRNGRIEPLADEARKIWAKLRQESSIDLDKITLSGQRTRGKVNLKATVDGVATEALPVMSQGELNAIALALFLPRATMSASPLQFVVLDDPVQAMDPAKVDGLTEVLIEYARNRQVVVFSHDDRLAESVRRTAPLARIVQVERSAGSKVEVTECQSPARRYVDDLRDLLRDENVPATVLDQAIPAYARLAVEAAAHEIYFRHRLTGGASRGEVEETWTKALKTTQRIALALYGAAGRDLSKWSAPASYRKATVNLCSRGVHGQLAADPAGALADVRRTVDDLLGARP
ncbi:AAA family ATPase [Kribbella sp. NBC_01510]|uniref:AAA family ATPase n=1 Tax=Kribbella sp. NBC_01510 TaxID=2903581 RepID=UPI00386CD351